MPGRRLAVAIAIVVLALGVLPVAAWVPGGAADPGYIRRWIEWGYGSAICAGAALIAIVLAGSRSSGRYASLGGYVAHVGDVLRRAPLLSDLGITAVCLIAYLTAAQSVLSGKPLLIDEIVQVLQARMYAGGHLSVGADSARAFFSVLHVVDVSDRVYSQFPPGWPAMLAVASMLRAEWIAGPVCGAVAVFTFAQLLRKINGRDAAVSVALGTLLFGLAPFSLFQFASHMSHGPALMWLLLATLALVHAVHATPEGAARRAALAAGFAAGCAFAVRPLDAVAFIAPAAVWLLWRARSGSAERAVAAMAVAGLVVPVVLVMWVNLQTTGDATQFGYAALWGPAHGLGFHEAPWGDAHTPRRGLELLSLYVTRLNAYLFETPFPSLLPALAALLIARPFSAIERFLFAATFVHAGLYFAYWHDGFYLGPRFVLPWVPGIVVLCVRLGNHVATDELPRRIRAAAVGVAVAGVLLSVWVAVPVRVGQYQTGLTSMRTDYAAEAQRAGATDAIVFVRESWGAQLVARLWELGVSRPATSTLYGKVDACLLEHSVTRLERVATRGSAAETALRPLLADSLRVRASNVSPDTTERMLPGSTYDAVCSAHVAADQEGYALYPPFLLERSSGNLYVRDLGARDSLLLHRFPGRRAFIVRRDGVDGYAPLRWIEIAKGRPGDSVAPRGP